MNRSATVYIAAINGPTTGGGHEIALACDLRFVSDAPHIRLGQIESLAGLIPGGGGTQRLPKLIGTAKALEHMLEGAPLTAQQALDLGLVNAIVPDNDLVAHAQDTAVRLARRSPVAIRAIKRLTYFTASRPLDAGLDSELAGFVSTGLQPAMNATLHAFAADLAELNDSPLSSGAPAWITGTRVNQTGSLVVFIPRHWRRWRAGAAVVASAAASRAVSATPLWSSARSLGPANDHPR